MSGEMIRIESSDQVYILLVICALFEYFISKGLHH